MINWLQKNSKVSYSQCGEDLIVDFIFNAIKISKPSYLDIGAHHPTYMNNTFLFYSKGSFGVCVEPDLSLFNNIKKIRKRDICLNVGIGADEKETAKFYILSSKSLNTFSLEDTNKHLADGRQKIESIVDMPLVNINKLISDYFLECPNFISIDVEGLDYKIIKSFDFFRYRPEVFCIETLTYTTNNTERKIDEIISYMIDQDYLLYADTYINTIFVNRVSWINRQKC